MPDGPSTLHAPGRIPKPVHHGAGDSMQLNTTATVVRGMVVDTRVIADTRYALGLGLLPCPSCVAGTCPVSGKAAFPWRANLGGRLFAFLKPNTNAYAHMGRISSPSLDADPYLCLGRFAANSVPDAGDAAWIPPPV